MVYYALGGYLSRLVDRDMNVKDDIVPTLINKAKISIGLMSKDCRKKNLVFIPVMVALLCLGSWSQTAWAAPCIVTNTNDSGGGSLRGCIISANGSPGTTISFCLLYTSDAADE